MLTFLILLTFVSSLGEKYYLKVLIFYPLFFFTSHWAYYSEKAMATHSSTLAWKIPWTEEPGGLQSMGSLRVGHDWATSLSLFPFMHWRRKWQPTPVFLPGESQGRGSLVGCLSMGSHRVGHDWSDLAAAAAAAAGHTMVLKFISNLRVRIMGRQSGFENVNMKSFTWGLIFKKTLELRNRWIITYQ